VIPILRSTSELPGASHSRRSIWAWPISCTCSMFLFLVCVVACALSTFSCTHERERESFWTNHISRFLKKEKKLVGFVTHDFYFPFLFLFNLFVYLFFLHIFLIHGFSFCTFH
jgi:hypothetical protein